MRHFLIVGPRGFDAVKICRFSLNEYIFGNINSSGLEKCEPISGKELKKLFYEAGYELVPGAGKGSHWKLKKKGYPVVIIPDHKELKKGTEHALRKLLEEAK